MSKIKQTIFSAINVDPCVFFHGTDEEIEAAERKEAEWKECFKELIESPCFDAMEFTNGIGSRVFLHRSSRRGIRWQLSYMAQDGVFSRHENYGGQSDLEAVHSMDDLYNLLVMETFERNLIVDVMQN